MNPLWKRRLAELAAVLTVSAAAPEQDGVKKVAPAEQPPEVVASLALKNPGFEAGEFAVSGWTRGQAIDGVGYEWIKDAGHESAGCVAIEKTAQRYFPIAEWYQEVANAGRTRRLRVKAWVKADKMRKAIVDVGFESADGKNSHQWAAYIGAKGAEDDPADHDWKLYEGVVAIPEDTKMLKIGLQVYGPGKIWFDDVTAEYVPDGVEPSLYTVDGKSKL